MHGLICSHDELQNYTAIQMTRGIVNKVDFNYHLMAWCSTLPCSESALTRRVGNV